MPNVHKRVPCELCNKIMRKDNLRRHRYVCCQNINRLENR